MNQILHLAPAPGALYILFFMLEHFCLSQNPAEGLRRIITKLKVWACLSQIKEKGTY